MKKKVYSILTLVLAVVFVVSAGMAIRQQMQYKENEDIYASAAELADFKPPKGTRVRPDYPESSQAPEEGDPLMQALESIQLAPLQEENPDVIGWIYIPDTELSYPLLHGKDNEFYLYRSWNKVRNNGGSVFFDYRCASDFSDFNTVLYAHRMRNDSMFGTLKYYETEDFWREHPTVYIVDNNGVHLYDIFAAWEPSVTSVVYSMDWNTEKKRQNFLDTCLKNSKLDTGIVPGPDNSILTLSTCTATGHANRWVVQAVERDVEAE